MATRVEVHGKVPTNRKPGHDGCVEGDATTTMPPAEPISAPMRQFLAWVDFRPRTRADAMEAWQSHCPRFTAWEDALAAELIELASTSDASTSHQVRLTARGRAALATR